MNSVNYICIISYPRSGSAALKRIVDATDGAFVANESNGVIIDLCNYINNIEALTSPLLYTKNGNLVEENMRNFKNIDMDKILNFARSSFVEGILNPPNESETVGWKENNISPVLYGEEKCFRYIYTIKKIFPNIKFIFNTRNPVDTSKSNMWNKRSNSIQEINKWINFLEKAYIKYQDCSVCISHDKWKEDFDYLADELKKININIRNEKCKKIYNQQLNHLKMW